MKDNIMQDIFVEITMTNACNCNCKYCFEGSHFNLKRDLSIETRQLELVLDLCLNFNLEKYKWLTLSFWGGEPFLNTDFMYKLISNTCNFLFVRYNIFSNGTLFEKYEDFLKLSFIENIKNRIHILLSYDGEPHHIIMRGKNGDIVLKTAKLLKENGISNFDFKATLTFEMIKYLPDIWKSYEKLYSYFGKNARYTPTLDTCTSNLEYYLDWKDALSTILLYEISFIKKYRYPLWSWFGDDHKTNCMLGNSIHLHSDGNIYICHGCAYKKNNDNLKLGNIYDVKSLNDVISEDFNFKCMPIQCQKCCATYCTVCHVNTISDTDNPKEKWISNRVNNNRCIYFKFFGFISKILKFISMR